MTHLDCVSTAKALVTDIPLTESQNRRDDNVLMFPEVLKLPMKRGQNDRGLSFNVAIQITMYLFFFTLIKIEVPCVPG